MIYGYIRVSTKEQNLDRQIDALKAYSPNAKIFSDKQSGKNFERKQYEALKTVLKNGDELIVKELDRLGRNKQAVKEELEWFKQNKIIVRILDVPTTLIDFQGQEWIFDMINNILIEVMASVAENERIKIRERQAEGIASAKERGKTWGNFRTIPQGFDRAVAEVNNGINSVSAVVKELGISRSTWYNLCKSQS